MQNAQITRKLLNVSETAELLGVSGITVRRLIYRGELPIVKIGRRVLIRPDDLERLTTSGPYQNAVHKIIKDLADAKRFI